MDNKQWISIRQASEMDAYPFSIGQIRHYLTKRHVNGLEKAVRKVGKRLYLRRDLFEQWIDAQSYAGGLK